MNLKSFTAGVLVGSIGLTTAYAAPISKMVNAVYSINAVTVDGKSIQFTEDNRPFTVDGTTYLPVRAVAEALDKNVDYDGPTATVKITSKSSGDTAITTPIQVADVLTVDMVSGYDSRHGQGIRRINNWDTKTKDNAGNAHSSGIEILTSMNTAYNDMTLDIALLGRYSNFAGQFALTEAYKSFNGEFEITILADDREIQTVYFKAGTLPQNLNLNVAGVQKLSFKFTQTEYIGSTQSVNFGLVDVTLSK